MAPFGILFAIVFIIPIFYAIYSSFFRQVTEGGGAYGGGELVNKFVGFQNFEYVLTSGNFWSGVGRVLIYTLIQVPLMIIIALALAMVIDSFVVKHITGFRLGYFLPYAIPGVVASIIWVYLYNGQISPIVKGLAAIGINVDFFSKNVVLASMANITTWTFTGYNMLIFLAALQAIPHELYEAARIDGASGWQISMRIKLPNVRSAALLSMLLSIVGTIQLFNEPQIMQTGRSGHLQNLYANDDGHEHIPRHTDSGRRRTRIGGRHRHGTDRRHSRHDLRTGREEGERTMSNASQQERRRAREKRTHDGKATRSGRHDLPRSCSPRRSPKPLP